MRLRSRLHVLLLAASVACGAQAQPTSAETPPAAAGPARPAVVLLLPAQSTGFARPAEALRLGFFAAHRASGETVTLQVVEIDDSSEQLAAALNSARERGVGVVVGPLPRAAVVPAGAAAGLQCRRPAPRLERGSASPGRHRPRQAVHLD